MKFLKPIFLTNSVFVLIGLLVLAFVLAFGYPIFFYVGYSLVIILLVALLFDLSSALSRSRNLELKRNLPLHFSMSDENEVSISIENNNRQAVTLILIDEIPVQFQERNFEIKEKLKAYQKKTVVYQLRPLTRGNFNFGNVNVFFRGRLGLIEYRKVIETPQTVKVYPSYVQMQKFEIQAFNSDRNTLGVRKIRRIGHGYDFSDIRQYVPGDDTRSINWKASSRTGTIMLNNYEDETSQQIYTVIDTSRSMRMPFNGLSLMDYSINSSLAILNIALKNMDKVGLISFSKQTQNFVAAQKRSDQLTRVLDELYNIQTSDWEANFTDLQLTLQQKVKSRSLMMLFTNFLSTNSVKRCLPQLKLIAKNHLLVVVFFENTELTHYRNEPLTDTLDMASKILADKLYEEMRQVIYELQLAGIQAIQSKPEELTTNTVNKYLELKSRGLI